MIVKTKVSNLKEAKARIESGEIIYVNDEDRGIGKTTAIIAYSNWKNIPIITSSNLYNILYKKEGAINVIVMDSPKDIYRVNGSTPRGLRVEALIDETISAEVLGALVDSGVKVAGFYYEK